MPGRPACLAVHTHETLRRGSLFGADTDRVGYHGRWVAVTGELKEPHGGQVDHDSFSGSVRQNKTHGQHDAFSGLRHPYIHTWISCTDSIESQAEVPCNIRQRITLFETNEFQPANDILSLCNRKLVSYNMFFHLPGNKRSFLTDAFHRSATMERHEKDNKGCKTKCRGEGCQVTNSAHGSGYVLSMVYACCVGRSARVVTAAPTRRVECDGTKKPGPNICWIFRQPGYL